MAILVVLSQSESFSSVWPDLARSCDATLRVVDSPDAVGPATDSTAVIVSVAGFEDAAEDVLRALATTGAPSPLLVGAVEDHRLASALIRAGAADYFALPGDLEDLRGELQARSARHSAGAARERLAAVERAHFDFSRMIGESAELRSTLDRAARIIPHGTATVLITGETGTGKEVLARAIHYNGPRAAAPFVEVNCTAIPEKLFESELFGHEKGAFTGATAAKPGLFEAASGGTLFLDEIGNLPYDVQSKLLKALEEKEVRRVGSVRSKAIDVRIIAATHVDLAAAVKRGEFREDLYYRLNVVPLHLPPLRARGEDVVLLAEHFLRSLAGDYELDPPRLNVALVRALRAHAWPGNVRELRNAIERALLLGGGSLNESDLFPEGRRPASATGSGIPFPATLDTIEAAAARAAVEYADGNKTAAADVLGISRSRLYRLLDGDSNRDDVPIRGASGDGESR